MKNIKRIFSAILVVMLLVSCTAFASSKKVTTGNVNMRKGASTSYGIVRTIPKGVTVTVTDSRKDGNGRTWYYTKYNGSSGWVYGRYLSSSGSKSGKYVWATRGSSYIRAKYNKTSKIKASLPQGDCAKYLGSSKKDGRGVRWYKVSYCGVTGWISSRYTTLK